MNDGTEKKIRVLLLDNQSIFREGLASQLQAEKSIVMTAETDNGNAIELIDRHILDILLYNIEEDAVNNFTALREIGTTYGNRLQIIGIADRHDKSIMYRFLYWGGSGYLLNSCPGEEYVQAIWCVSGGGVFVCPELGGLELKKCALHSGSAPEPGILKDISVRERDVLILFNHGKTVKRSQRCCTSA